jgi:hypothetical protein
MSSKKIIFRKPYLRVRYEDRASLAREGRDEDYFQRLRVFVGGHVVQIKRAVFGTNTKQSEQDLMRQSRVNDFGRSARSAQGCGEELEAVRSPCSDITSVGVPTWRPCCGVAYSATTRKLRCRTFTVTPEKSIMNGPLAD